MEASHFLTHLLVFTVLLEMSFAPFGLSDQHSILFLQSAYHLSS